MTAMLEFNLPERLSVAEENGFLPFLQDNPDASLDVSAARLRRIDTPLVQALLAAAADRQSRGVAFRLTGLSADQAEQIRALGVTEAMLTLQVTQ